MELPAPSAGPGAEGHALPRRRPAVRPGAAGPLPRRPGPAWPDVPRDCVVVPDEMTSREATMSDFQAIADRVEIEALRGEFTDAAMMRDYDRLASLFTSDGALRMPNIPAELEGREQIRAWGDRVPDLVDFLVQNTHPGAIRLDGDSASGRAYMNELGRARDGRSELNYAIYHDRYQRTGDGWRFTERVYEVRYHDTTPLTGSPPPAAEGAGGDQE